MRPASLQHTLTPSSPDHPHLISNPSLLQAAKAAALATVPGAAQYAGKRAVEVAMVRYAGVVAQARFFCNKTC